MLGMKSPHLWGIDLADDPRALKALQEGTPVRVRYRDPVMRFRTKATLRRSPGPQSRRPRK